MAKLHTRTLAGIAVFSALVIVFQLLGSFIRFGTFSISLVLMPIAVGAALYGCRAGAWLGFVFGVTVLLSGDAALFLGWDVFGTVVTVLSKGIAAGFFAGAVYRLLEKKSTVAATVAAAVICPIVNTGVFLVCCLLFFADDVALLADTGVTPLMYILLFFIGINFILELLANALLSPVIVRILKAVGVKNRAS